MDHLKKDDRFAHIAKDPRFHQLPSKERKVKIDKRFKSMFKEKKFKLKYTVDKRGRPINTSTNENLRKFYELSDSGSEDSDDNNEEDVRERKLEEKKKIRDNERQKSVKKGQRISVDSSSSEENQGKKLKKKKNLPGKSNVVEDKEKNRTSESKKKDELNRPDDSNKSGKKKLKKGAEHFSKKSEEVLKTVVEPEDSEDENNGSEDGSETEDEETSSSEESDTPQQDVSSSVLAGPDLARGEGLESSSDDEWDEEIKEGDNFDHNWGEMDKSAPEVVEATSRLAVCNMDWDRIKAQDIMVMVGSFKPQGGVIKSVKIYPSEFGLKRLREEEMHGPKELTEDKLDSDDEDPLDADNEAGSQYHREKLREYQLNRLKYYYAVIECDSKETANTLYTECDGLEYESSSARLDLRFIPEDMTFEHEPKSVVTGVSDMSTYKPSLFFTTALNQSKVQLTWDETDQDRLKVTMKKPKSGDIDEMDVQAYLASSSGEEEVEDEIADDDNEGDRLNKYRSLLKEIESKDKSKEERNTEMEISWEPGLRDTAADLVKKKAEEKDMTPWEQYLKKKREKQKKKREEKTGKKTEQLEPGDSEETDDDLPAGIDLNDPYFKEEMEDAVPSKKDGKGKKKKKKQKEEETEEGKQKQAELQLLMMDEDDDQQHFNLKDIMQKEKLEKKKRRKKKKMKETTKVEDTFEIDVSDPRFDAMYRSHHYNIDPSSHEFKKTKAMEAIVQEKLKRKKHESEKGKTSGAVSDSKKIKLDSVSSSRTDYEEKSLLSLVKSVKMKTQQFQKKKDLQKS